MRAYWKMVAAQAYVEARDFIREHWGRPVSIIIAGIMVVWIVSILGSDAGWFDALLELGGLLVVILIIFSAWFVVRMITIPARLHAEQEAQISSIEALEDDQADKWAALRSLRREGVKIRNQRLITILDLPKWTARYEKWRLDIIEAVGHLSPNLRSRIEVLNEMYGIPANAVPMSKEHKRQLGIMSEILRRVEKYIEKHE